MGQLTDGIVGHDDYYSNETVHGYDRLGYDWIGWKKRDLVIHLTFYFLQQQNFSSIRIFTSNLFIRQIYQFRTIRIESCEGEMNQWIDQVVPVDTEDSNARWIEIFIDDEKPLISQCLNIQLEYGNQSEWILISEVQFNSAIVFKEQIIRNHSNSSTGEVFRSSPRILSIQ